MKTPIRLGLPSGPETAAFAPYYKLLQFLVRQLSCNVLVRLRSSFERMFGHVLVLDEWFLDEWFFSLSHTVSTKRRF